MLNQIEISSDGRSIEIINKSFNVDWKICCLKMWFAVGIGWVEIEILISEATVAAISLSNWSYLEEMPCETEVDEEIGNNSWNRIL